MVTLVVLTGEGGALFICKRLSLCVFLLARLIRAALAFAFSSRPEKSLVGIPGDIFPCAGRGGGCVRCCIWLIAAGVSGGFTARKIVVHGDRHTTPVSQLVYAAPPCISVLC